MKKLLLSVVAMLIASTSFAQNGLVASLSSGTNVTYYYGVNALKDAVAAAASGDIINLSGGSFNATDITKAITIRGAGIDSEAPTCIVNNITINIPSDDTNQFVMEGVRCVNTMKTIGQYTNPYFVRCQFNAVSNNDSKDAISNIMFANCKITGNFTAGGSCTYSFVNCFITNFAQYEAATITASNCIFEGNYYNSNNLKQCQFFNCIFVITSVYHAIPNSSQATNCISVNAGSHDFFVNLSIRAGCPTTSLTYATVFKTFTGTYSDTETFELTEEAKTTYLGTDGTEIGLYGGLLPYNTTPSYPLISKMEVEKQTTPEGQLGVTIEVSK